MPFAKLEDIVALIHKFDLHTMIDDADLEKITTSFICSRCHCEKDIASSAYHDERNKRMLTIHRVQTYLRDTMGWAIPIGLEFFITRELTESDIKKGIVSIANKEFLSNYSEYITFHFPDHDERKVYFMACSKKLHDCDRMDKVRTENEASVNKITSMFTSKIEELAATITALDAKYAAVQMLQPVPVSVLPPVLLPPPAIQSQQQPSQKLEYHMLSDKAKLDADICLHMLSKNLVRSYSDIPRPTADIWKIIDVCTCQRILKYTDAAPHIRQNGQFAMNCIGNRLIQNYNELHPELKQDISVVLTCIKTGLITSYEQLDEKVQCDGRVICALTNKNK